MSCSRCLCLLEAQYKSSIYCETNFSKKAFLLADTEFSLEELAYLIFTFEELRSLVMSDDLLARLRQLSVHVKTDCSEQPKSTSTLTDATQAHISEYFRAIESGKKQVDPKITAQRQKLPIFKRKDELLDAIKNNQILIVIGQTGSGKTTQITQYLREIGISSAGRIGCTQLRRVAARAVARRVAKEQGCKLGEDVGYTIRFEDRTSPQTAIQYMTDGILLRECTRDRMLSNYAAVILDESHERTVDTDILIGVLKWITGRRNDLKLIISSATLDAEKFSDYFYGAQVFHVEGRMYPVEVRYFESDRDYEDQAYAAVIRINEQEAPGDVLVFMTGEMDIEILADHLEAYVPLGYPQLTVLRCYAALSWEDQELIFKPAEPGHRKVVIATNIAETSLTIDGISYVIDSGYVKQKTYDPRKDMEVLKPIRVSQAQAIQRAGRAGRVGPGICYRLYSEREFNIFAKSPNPEISRSSLTNCVLMLKLMGFVDVKEFDFIDKPPADSLQTAVKDLELFQAIEGVNGPITEIGKQMASFPLDPNLAKMLIISEKLGCSADMLTIVALLSVPNIFFRPRKKQKLADLAKMAFNSNYGDLVTMLNVYVEWERQDRDRKWCHDFFVNNTVLRQADSIREQLLDIMLSRSMKIKSSIPDYVPIQKSICSGFFQNVAQKGIRPMRQACPYITLPNRVTVFIHPGSSLNKKDPEWVVYQKIVKTSKEYMRGITPINVGWLKEFMPAFDNPLGHLMHLQIFFEPQLAKMLIISEKLGCSADMLTIVALLSVPDIFERSKEELKLAAMARKTFHSKGGDLITMLKVYREWKRQSRSSEWCRDSYVRDTILEQARSIRQQLKAIMKFRSMKIQSSKPNITPIQKSICYGFSQNVAQRVGQPMQRPCSYRTLPNNLTVYIHPYSSLYKKDPEWVVYQKMVKTSREYMHGITPINVGWLKEFMPSSGSSLARLVETLSQV